MTSNNMPAAQDAKNVIQSYIFSRLRASLSVYELRLLMRVVEFAQCELQGLIIRQAMEPHQHGLSGRIVEIPINSVLTDASHHYERIIDAARSMLRKVVEYYSTDGCEWTAASLISGAHSSKGKGTIALAIQPWVWDCILDFTKGFVKYDLGAAMRLSSAHAVRLYFLMSNQQQPICYSFNELKRMFGVLGKYDRTNDFIRKVLLPAKSELDRVSPWTCEIRPIRDGRKFETCMFYPYEQRDKYTEGVAAKAEHAKYPTVWAYHELYQYMRYNIGFSPLELGRNKALVHEFAEKVPRAMEIIADMNYRARRREVMPEKGWFINGIKAELRKIQDN